MIFIYPVDEVIRIRNGERGQDALKYQDDIDSLSKMHSEHEAGKE